MNGHISSLSFGRLHPWTKRLGYSPASSSPLEIGRERLWIKTERGTSSWKPSMHRFFVAVIAVLLLGCLSAESMVGGDPSELRIVVWEYHLVGQQEYYRELVQAFERANPGHRVVIRLESWNTAHEKIRHWVSAGGGDRKSVV
jgi:hypothetical protein